ncbi:MAG TPA: helix-turn-helix transcriptional regulator [Stellaceae bacterium]|nr:helix-turn-helix transcriptional regulator [Stellaceae bacterium]
MSAPTDRLIELIASAAINVDAWQDVLDDVAGILPGAKIMMHAEDADARGNVGLIHSGFSAEAIRRYIEYYSALNPWTKSWLAIPTMTPQISDNVLPAAAFAGSEYHDDFLLKYDDIRHAAGIKIFHEADRVAMVSIHYGEPLAEKYNSAAWALLRDLGPHLRMALEVSRQLSRSPAAAAAAMSDAINAMPAPACLVTQQGKLVLANDRFIAECRTRKYIVADAANRIRPADYRLHGKFDALIRNATEPRPLAETQAATSFTMSLSAGQAGAKSMLTVVGIRASSQIALPWTGGRPSHALLIIDHAAQSEERQASLVADFALTQAEYQLAKLIGDGQSLRDAADCLNISYETARSRLKIVFGKTGVHRQAGLVALMAGRNRNTRAP